jgi:DNA-binding transcriptional ArsR family regulator
VLDLLGSGELPVNRIAAPFAMTRPAISQHLRILRRAGLVAMRRDGRERYYRLRAAPLRAVYDWVAHYERFWPVKLSSLGEYLDKEETT